MNYERLRKLFDRCDKVDKQIEALSAQVEQLEKELKEAESEPEYKRVEQGKEYYHVEMGCDVCINSYRDDRWYDETSYDNNNYFHTKERAQEVADKIKLLLKLERLHDTYCPDYKPDWLGNNLKYIICKQYEKHRWTYDYRALVHDDNAVQVYFPTKEIAQKVCDILNKEREEHDNS